MDSARQFCTNPCASWTNFHSNRQCNSCLTIAFLCLLHDSDTLSDCQRISICASYCNVYLRNKTNNIRSGADQHVQKPAVTLVTACPQSVPASSPPCSPHIIATGDDSEIHTLAPTSIRLASANPFQNHIADHGFGALRSPWGVQRCKSRRKYVFRNRHSTSHVHTCSWLSSAVKKAYRKRALQTHPDRLPRNATDADRERATDEFRKVSPILDWDVLATKWFDYQVNNAYEVLNDTTKREVRFSLSESKLYPKPMTLSYTTVTASGHQQKRILRRTISKVAQVVACSQTFPTAIRTTHIPFSPTLSGSSKLSLDQAFTSAMAHPSATPSLTRRARECMIRSLCWACCTAPALRSRLEEVYLTTWPSEGASPVAAAHLRGSILRARAQCVAVVKGGSRSLSRPQESMGWQRLSRGELTRTSVLAHYDFGSLLRRDCAG